MAQVQINQAQLDEIKRLLESIGSQSRSALKRSVKRTVTGVKTQVAKELRQVVTLKSAYIKQCITSDVEIDTALGVKGKITIHAGKYGGRYSYWTPLAQYSYSKTKKGINARVYKNGAAKLFKHAFVPKFNSGHTGIFQVKYKNGVPERTSTGKSRIVELVGNAVSETYQNQPGLKERVEADAGNRLVTELNRQIAYILSQRT